MKKNFTKKKGFTLIEVVISFCVIGIISAGAYGMYRTMIKTTKISEEKQSISLVGKRVIEDINIIPSNNIKLSNGHITIEGLSEIDDLIQMDGDVECFQKKFGLDKSYKHCELDSPNKLYEEMITIKKAKGVRDSDKKDINIDKETENNAESDEKIYPIVCNFDMSKEKGEDKNSKINGETISSSGENLELNVYIENLENNSIKIIIEDKDGKILFENTDSLTSDVNKTNNLNLHFNFKNYLIGEEELEDTNKKMNINVYNKISEDSNSVVNVYIEKSFDLAKLNVEAVAKRGEVTRFSRDDDEATSKIGPLYYINVEIKSKEGEILFSGQSTKNINIE